MGDRIDERNEKERISRSIIKFWNVNYIPTPQVNREVAEDKADAAENQKEKVASEKPRELAELYNATTGSYSGAYGAEGVSDEVTKGRINRILREKDEALRNLIEENSEEE